MCVNNRKAELARQSSTADQEVTDVREYIYRECSAVETLDVCNKWIVHVHVRIIGIKPVSSC